ncbi:MAG: FAD-dependent oxidoreductase [Actinomycetota bacterium]|nr:FAD-dependent oxidoreductase [Actinomycetota bacterium]
MSHLLIIGGSDAGVSAGLRARELDDSVEVTLVVADAYPNFSICGLPYYLSGDVPDWRSLAHRTRDELERAGFRMLLDHTARAIDATARKVVVTDLAGKELELGYDKLIVATGALPIRPPIRGLELPGVHVLHTMKDSFSVHEAASLRGAESAAIVGAGYIGLEMAEAFAARGLKVTVIEQLGEVLPTVDPELGALVRDELVSHQVEIVTGVRVENISQKSGALTVYGTSGLKKAVDLVLVVVGVRPDSELAVAAGAEIGVKSAIRTSRQMKTNLPDIFAAGDCVETYHRILGAPTYLPLGTTAHKQGTLAGENAVGGDRFFEGSLGTQVVKVFELAAARSGLRDNEGRDAGFDPLTVGSAAFDRKVYYPGARDLAMRITGDRTTGRLLGAQIVGHRDAQVAKRIDIPAVAMYGDMLVDDLNDLDLSYTPPFGSPWDAVQIAARTWSKRRATLVGVGG